MRNIYRKEVKLTHKKISPTKKKSDPKDRLINIDKLHREIESKIMMTDDDEELLMMGALFLSTCRNIFVAIHGVKKTKIIISNFVKEIK